MSADNVTPIRPSGAPAEIELTAVYLCARLEDLQNFLESHRAALRTCMHALWSDDDGVHKEVATVIDDYVDGQLGAKIEELQGLLAEYAKRLPVPAA